MQLSHGQEANLEPSMSALEKEHSYSQCGPFQGHLKYNVSCMYSTKRPLISWNSRLKHNNNTHTHTPNMLILTLLCSLSCMENASGPFLLKCGFCFPNTNKTNGIVKYFSRYNKKKLLIHESMV